MDIGTIHWIVDDCADPDQTDWITDVTPGVPIQLQVVNANWCGCGVWVDLNNNNTFDANENFHGTYGSLDTSTYNIQITLPVGTAPGPHRMRIVAGWGTDCLNPGDNGYGPCGNYQYGNHNDFTLNVVGSSNVPELAGGIAALASVNPTEGPVRLNVSKQMEHIRVFGPDGRSLMDVPVADRTGTVDLDLSSLPGGVYQLQCQGGSEVALLRIIKC